MKKIIHHIWAVLWKQLKDTLKNKTILIQFLMFPCMTVVMENSVSIQGMPKHFFANLFAIMYVGMAPLTAMSAIISEEKEKNTLRVLQMCSVNAFEYLLGNAIYIISVCMLGSFVIAFAGGYTGGELQAFLLIMFIGHMISMFAGAAIGVLSENQMTATSLTVPVMMVCSFLPMLSMFNDAIGKAAKYIYSEQLYLMMNQLGAIEIKPETIIIMCANVIFILGCFVFAYRKAFVINR